MDSPQLPRPISQIYFRGCPERSRAELLARMPIHEGATLSEELLERALQAAKALDEHLEILVTHALSREVYVKLPEKVRNKLTPPAGDDGVNVTVYDPTCLPQRIRVEGIVQESLLIEKVMPVCPRQAGEGVAQLSVVVGKDGAVLDVGPLAGPELLIDSAMDAVRRWRYRPMLLNGLPVEVQTVVEVSLPPDR